MTKLKVKKFWFIPLVILLGLASAQARQPVPAYAKTLPVIAYHAIRTIHDERLGMTVIDKYRFEQEMTYLHDHGYTTLSIDEVVQFLQGKKFPPKIVAITFDDSLSSQLEALPILQQYHFKASFWAITGVAAPNPAAPGADFSYMNWATLKRLDEMPGMAVYSHSVTHPWQQDKTFIDWAEGRTPGKTKQDVLFELTESRRLLEQDLGHSVPYFAWPAGAYNQDLTNIARQAGYKAVMTVVDTLNKPGGDPFQIHRTMINGKCDEKTFEQMMQDGVYRECDQ
jgi:peptidoglycan/xylan/chitin deacetylase (PgdA/CDA1 family)